MDQLSSTSGPGTGERSDSAGLPGEGGARLLRRRDQLTVLPLLAAVSLLLAGISLHRVPSPGDAPHPTRLTESYQPRIAVNICDWAELCLLPGVGETLAKRIVAERESGGAFRADGDLQRVPGIGPKTSAKLAAHLDFSCLARRTTRNMNRPWPLE